MSRRLPALATGRARHDPAGGSAVRSATGGLLLALLTAQPGGAQRSAFDSARVERVGAITCHYYGRYSVATRERAGETGSDIVVHPRPQGGCTMDSTPGSFVFRNRWAEYFAGLIGDRLVLDSGTGPDLRDLIVIDLTRRRMIYQDSYVDLEPGGPDTPPGTLGLWQGYDLEQPAPGCPPPGGLQPGVDSLVWLDVRNGQTRFAGRTRCAVRQ